MNKKMCGFIYGVVITLLVMSAVNHLSTLTLVRIYASGSIITFFGGLILYVYGRKCMLDRAYKNERRPKPTLWSEVKRDLKADGIRTFIILLFLTALSWLAWVQMITDNLEDKLGLE